MHHADIVFINCGGGGMEVDRAASASSVLSLVDLPLSAGIVEMQNYQGRRDSNDNGQEVVDQHVDTRQPSNNAYEEYNNCRSVKKAAFDECPDDPLVPIAIRHILEIPSNPPDLAHDEGCDEKIDDC